MGEQRPGFKNMPRGVCVRDCCWAERGCICACVYRVRLRLFHRDAATIWLIARREKSRPGLSNSSRSVSPARADDRQIRKCESAVSHSETPKSASHSPEEDAPISGGLTCPYETKLADVPWDEALDS